LRFEAEFLVGNIGAGDADFAEVTLNNPGFGSANDCALAEVLVVAIDQADRLAGFAGEGLFGGPEPKRDGEAEGSFALAPAVLPGPSGP
jgi:hypothetical protein